VAPACSHFPDPVAAYDRVAPHFDLLSQARRPYLDAIEDQIIARIPPGAQSLLDVGAGDGRRALRIAERAGLQKVVLVEPSREMTRPIPAEIETWTIRAEELVLHTLPTQCRSFDVITCLWNVLGHIRPQRARTQVLSCLRAMLSPEGILFVDITHRYNASCYGVWRTACRFVRDQVRPSECNGDVTAKWEMEELHCSTYGHVFTGREMRGLAIAAELDTQERVVVDYATGRPRRFGFQGNLLYVLRPRNSSSNSASVVQTSPTSAAVI
jgi:2-polyprenyl-3-methyl-5-hydroxy-6-metoxy-1,4-benzoquinol methylase